MVSKKEKEKIENKRKIGKVVLFLVLIAFICVNATLFSKNVLSIVEVREIPLKVKVSGNLGLGLGDESLNFGSIPAGSTSMREVVISNDKDVDLDVEIYKKGRISRLLNFEEKRFLVKKGEDKRIKFSVFVPEDTKEGEYEGELILIFRRNDS